MRFDLVDLRLFVHVLETGTITQGAQRSHITLASASERIRGMEAVLGAPLLMRNKRGVTPTDAGNVLQQHARRMLLQMEQLSSDMQAFGQGLGMRIELLANTSAISEYLTEPVGTFLLHHPNLRLELRECTSDAIAKALQAGEADVGVLSDAVDCGSLHTRPWHADPLVLLGPASLLQGLPPAVLLGDVHHLPMLGLLPQHALQQLVASQALRTGVALRFRALAPHLDALCGWVAMGVGCAVVPLAAAQRCMAQKPHTDLKVLPLDAPWAQRHLLIACRNPLQLPPHAQLLIDYLGQLADGSYAIRAH